MDTVNFHHVALNCRDLKIIEGYYTKHFGFKRARVIPLGEGREIIFLKGGTVYLELFQSTEEPKLPPPEGDGRGLPGVRHLAFKVIDVDATLARMGEDGKRATLGPLSFDSFIPGWRSVWLADPEGNILEISQGYVDEESF